MSSSLKNKNVVRSLTVATAIAGLTACGGSHESKDMEKEKRNVVPAFDVASLDTTIAPCENFFHFSSNGWIAENPIPESEPRWGRFNELIEANNEKIKGILEEFSDKENLKKGTDEQLIGDLYHSGMDSTTIENNGLKVVEPIFEKIAAVDSREAYVDLMAELDMGIASNPFGMYVGPDSKNSTVNALHLSQSGLSLPDKDYYLKDDSASVLIQQQYQQHIAKMFVLKGDDEATAQAKAETIYNVEKAMAGNMMSRVERRNPENTYNKMSFADADALMPNISLVQYTQLSGVKADSVIVGQPDYLRALDQLFAQFPLEDWKTYSSWKVFTSAAGYLPTAFVEENFDFYGRTLGGSKEMKPRWKRVLGTTNGLSEQLGHLFVDKYFSEDSKKAVESMVEDLRSAYRERIKQLNWMGDATKQKAMEKLDAFTYKIGYPNKWKDYSDLEIVRDSYLQNVYNLGAYKTKENYAKLGKPVDKDDWFMGAHIVNAYYNPQNNEVVFPAGILQPPFYNPDADDAINYGAIGGVIGHEFTHGFDDQGSKYGPDGNLEQWWTADDRARFDTLANRLIRQYDAYEPIEGVHVNGSLTIGENIADLGGLTLGYYAYLKSREGKDPVEPIDGFTDKQRVFLGWAQVWQMHATDSYTRKQVMTDPHSPAEFRVVGPMSNMPEFKEAWGCDNTGSAMVKSGEEEQIIIW